jgi:hypothetical protein
VSAPRPPRDPVELMLEIAEKFLSQAVDYDGRVELAVEASASQGDIVALTNLADTSRLRALACAQAAAPFVRPRLQAIELAPATPVTRSRFDERIAAMSEDEVLRHLKAIAAGTATVALLEGEVERMDSGVPPQSEPEGAEEAADADEDVL